MNIKKICSYGLMFALLTTPFGLTACKDTEAPESSHDEHSHTGRYQCEVCKMDFGNEFKNIIKNAPTEISWVNESVTTKIITNETYEVAIVQKADFGLGYSIVALCYSSFDKNWTWEYSMNNPDGSSLFSNYGTFDSLSSAAVSIPCSNGTLSASKVKTLMDTFSMVVPYANSVLEAHGATFTMENLGLKF